MDVSILADFNFHTWVLIPALIFIARIMDVTMGTLKLIFVSRGFKKLAPIMGFFEILIWLVAIQQILLNLSNWLCYFAYAAGFAVGTYAGMYLEERISIGKVILRVITKRDATQLKNTLVEEKYVVTDLEGEGPKGKVKILFMIIDRKEVKRVVAIVKRFNPNAFYSIEDVRAVNQETTPKTSAWKRIPWLSRKSK